MPTLDTTSRIRDSGSRARTAPRWPAEPSGADRVERLLGEVELETVQEGLEGDLELLGTSVLAQQPLEPRHRGTAAQVDLAVPVGNGRLPFVEWFLDGRRLC